MTISKYTTMFINSIDSFISSDPILSSKFTHHNCKYSRFDLLYAVFYGVKKGISYRCLHHLNNSTMHWSTIHKFHIKLANHDVFNLFHTKIISDYLVITDNKIKKFYIDSAFILNKGGIDKVTYNAQVKKHKTGKISLVADEFNVVIDVCVGNSNKHDAKYAIDHIDNLQINHPSIMTNDNVLIGDGGYDSDNIRNCLSQSNFGKLICEYNNRNTKNPKKIKTNNGYDKMLLQSRSKIEHTNNTMKQYKKVNIRYDKYIKNYKSNVMLTILHMTFNKTKNLFILKI